MCSHLHGARGRYVNNQREHYSFLFSGVLQAEAKQEEACTAHCLQRAAS